MKNKKIIRPLIRLGLILAFIGSVVFGPVAEAALSSPLAAQITSPEKFFGFRLGADRKIARWDKIVAYYQLLAKESDRVKVVNMGPSTMGNPFLLVIVSSPANLAKLERLRDVNLKISDPRGLGEPAVRALVAEGRAVICQSMSLHATEIGGTQMAPELVFDLLARGDEETRRILDNVVFLLVPSFNPDGAIMVADWYQKYLGTEYEGSDLPWLYHKYTGHDNNRDAFQTNTVESQYMAKILFTDWIPQAYIDHHHMGSYGPRIFVPPYAEPVRPLADPLVWREMSWYGAHIAYKEQEAGLSGVINMAQYSGWGHFGFHWITPFHNIAGMLTESADAKLATPLYIHPDQLEGGDRGLPAYAEQTTFPDPWPGGWWTLRDIVDRQKVSAWATLDIAARNKETVLWNAYLKAKRQSERGAQGKPAAYIIPADQHDPLTAVKLVNKLLVQGIEIVRSSKGFVAANDRTYGPGSYVVSLAQPKMGLIRYLLGRTFYPDNTYTRGPDGSPVRPYDMATDAMAEFMGVRVDPVDQPVREDLKKLAGPIVVAGRVVKGAFGYVLDGRLNDSFTAVSLLLDKGIPVKRVDRIEGESGRGLKSGDFFLASGSESALADIAARTGVDFAPLAAEVQAPNHPVKRMRTGMYQRYNGGNMDEGWTRLLLEQFSLPYTTLMDAAIKAGNLNEKFDVIILPNDSTVSITGEESGRDDRPREPVPPEYRSGIGTAGVEALKAFVRKGGTLVALGRATAFVIDKFALPVRNALAGKTSKEFWCPGSTLRVAFDTRNPLSYGMPEEGLIVFLGDTPALEIIPNEFNEKYERVVTFGKRDLLQGGMLIGEENLAGKSAMISAAFGDGRVVLIGFRAQHRAQTHGTYKLLFNALIR